jgi:DNA repair protein RadC
MKTTNNQTFYPDLNEIQVKVNRKGKSSDRPTIKSSDDAFKIINEIFESDTFNWTESVVMLCLSRSNKIIGWRKISQGGTTASLIDGKVIFTLALNCVGTSGIILAHNHPSGNPNPSSHDIETTKNLIKFGKLIDIQILDHLIMTEDGYTSLTDAGHL